MLWLSCEVYFVVSRLLFPTVIVAICAVVVKHGFGGYE
jgi:hypothetical protein